MQVFAVRTVYGEIIGQVADDFKEETLETENCLSLSRPLMLHMMATPQGMMNAMVPVNQFLPNDTLDIALHHMVAFGPANPAAAKAYLELTSGIALPRGGAGSKNPLAGLQIVKN